MDFGNDSVDPYNPMVVDASDHAGEYIALNPNSWRVGNAEIPGSIPMEQNGDDNMSVDMLNNGETNMNLPEAPTILEFLNFPEMYRPQESFIRDFIEDETVLTHAIKQPNPLAVRSLLSHGADPNMSSKKGVTPISAASYKGNIQIMQMLIDKGAEVNALNLSGSTALIQASHFGHKEAVSLLLHHNAAADFANSKGTTALMRSSQEGHVEISKVLISARADVNRKNLEGMNALMLASQRGHSDMVVLLIKAGAAMDEQTTQGSTALMLACKRGHQKCVSELVGMGAEIHILDGRDRSAKDTALKRHHVGLLCLLSTQVQIRKIQESRRHVRAALLGEMRSAYQRGLLRFSPPEQIALALLEEVKRQAAVERSAGAANDSIVAASSKAFTAMRPGSSGIPLDHPVQSAVARGLAWPASSTIVANSTAGLAIDALSPEIQAAFETIKALATSPQREFPSIMHFQRRGVYDWQWPFLLYRVMGMPYGIFELIADFLPSPRIWQWSLYRLKRRCAIAPYVAITDLSVIVDEILADANIFAGPDQKNLLIKINKCTELHPILADVFDMPPSLLTSLCIWADTQSILSRTNEGDVAFKAPFARRMLLMTAQLKKWYRHRCSAGKSLGLLPEGSGAGLCEDEEGDGLDVAETAGGDNSDNNLLDDDTDQDAPGDGDEDDNAADSDEGEPQGGGFVL